MTFSRLNPVERAERYAKTKKMTIEDDFGYGCDGFVFSTSKGTAIKAFRHQQLNRNELEIYEYLQKWAITKVVDYFHIPQLISFDPGLSVIEMTIVSPPFILDFVNARIEVPVEFDDDWLRQKQDEFEGD